MQTDSKKLEDEADAVMPGYLNCSANLAAGSRGTSHERAN